MEQNYNDIIMNAYSSLSPSERKVADFAMENMPVLVRMSMREVKNGAGVSEPTVVRFCRAIGFEGFTDFKISMAQQMGSYETLFPGRQDGKSDLEQLIRGTLQSERDLIDVTMRCIDLSMVEAAAKLITRARRICFFGVCTSSEICRDASRKLVRLNMSVWNHSDIHDALLLVSEFGPDDLLFCVSHSGQTPEIHELLHVVHAKKTPTILMTSFPNKRLCRDVDVLLRTFSKESTNLRLSLLSRVGQHAVFDAVYMAVLSFMEGHYADMLAQTTRDLYSRESE
ncbi:MAG: MurR/RpiR family transcriptional regulator [Eubacteriales bacterium]|nr:MurR/RpiR family transcriptional regulator [Eubacteriales bacterium]